METVDVQQLCGMEKTLEQELRATVRKALKKAVSKILVKGGERVTDPVEIAAQERAARPYWANET